MTINKTLNAAISVPNVAIGKNKIINGNFDFWQRTTSLTSTATVNEYSADRWRSEGYSTNTVVSRQAFTGGQTDVPNNPNYYCRVALTTTNSSGYWAFQQRIEAPQMMRAYGTYTLSFWVRATSGSVNAGTWNYGINGVTGTGPALTTAWQKITHTVTISSAASETAGYVTIYLIYLPTNTPAVSFDVAQVQLEVGSVASPFEVRPYGMELQFCQRYYQVMNAQIDTAQNGTSYSYASWFFKTTMRAVPTVTQTGTAVGGQNNITADAAQWYSTNAALRISTATAAAEL